MARQKVLHYRKEGDEEVKELIIPKVINSDISFEMMFGMEAPRMATSMKPSILEKDASKLNLRNDYYGTRIE